MTLLHRFAGNTGRISIFLGSHMLGMLGLFGRLLMKTLGLLTFRSRFPTADFLRQVDRLGILLRRTTLRR